MPRASGFVRQKAISTSHTGAGGADDAGPPAAPGDGLPDGYTAEHRTTATGRNFFVVCAPDGTQLPSRPVDTHCTLALRVASEPTGDAA
jgi:hypothetical protein